MTIEIVDFPIENGDFPYFLYVYQRVVFLEFSEWIFSGGKPCHSCGLWHNPAPRDV
jgi:hypothetical protein